MNTRIMIGLLILLTAAPAAFGETIADRLKRAKVAEHVEKMTGKDYLDGGHQEHLTKLDVVVRLKATPTKEQVTDLKSLIYSQSPDITEVRHIGGNLLQITLGRTFTQKEQESLDAEVMKNELVLDVEFLDHSEKYGGDSATYRYMQPTDGYKKSGK